MVLSPVWMRKPTLLTERLVMWLISYSQDRSGQPKDFLLVCGESVEDLQNICELLLLLQSCRDCRSGMRLQLQLGVADSSHASLLSKHIQRAITADRIQPLRQMVADLGRLLAQKLQEGVLNDFPRSFHIARDMSCIARQRFFVFG